MDTERVEQGNDHTALRCSCVGGGIELYKDEDPVSEFDDMFWGNGDVEHQAGVNEQQPDMGVLMCSSGPVQWRANEITSPIVPLWWPAISSGSRF